MLTFGMYRASSAWKFWTAWTHCKIGLKDVSVWIWELPAEKRWKAHLFNKTVNVLYALFWLICSFVWSISGKCPFLSWCVYWNPNIHISWLVFVIELESVYYAVRTESSHSAYHQILWVIKSIRKRWAGHMARMESRRSAYWIVVGRPDGKRTLWRPRLRKEDNIKTCLKEVGWGCMDWIDLAQHGDRWRSVVKAVMNLRVL